MAELDLDKDLQNLMGDLEQAAGEGEAAQQSAGSDAPKETPGGEDFSLDKEMQAMMSDAPASPKAGGAAPTALTPHAGAVVPVQGGANLDFLLDIKLNVTFEVGRAKMLISDLLTLGQGSVIELHRLVGDELDLLINGRLVAKGEVVVINEKFGCRITNIISPADRVKHMGGM